MDSPLEKKPYDPFAKLHWGRVFAFEMDFIVVAPATVYQSSPIDRTGYVPYYGDAHVWQATLVKQ